MKPVRFKMPHIEESRTRKRNREQILQTAYEMIAERGLFILSISDLARQARLTRRTVYNYYETFRELLADLHPLVIKHFTDECEHWLEKTGTDRIFKPESGGPLYSLFSAMNAVMHDDPQMLRYLVRLDHFLAANPDLLERSLHPAPYIVQHGGIREALRELCDEARAEELALMAAESFIAYTERITFRRGAFSQAGMPRAADFHQYLSIMINGILQEARG
jgi:AcrR family transcriptional regulator